jgi:DNA topoisomerase IB
VPRLRRSDCTGPGIHRVRRGRGFAYLYDDGSPVLEDDALARIQQLVLPPAWKDVWICPWPNGHIQAIGTDAAGRRQYRYHDQWREQRDAAKHDRILEVARRLPPAREVVQQHLDQPGYPKEKILGTAFRLLDLGFFRVGSEEYAAENNTFGLATIRREHVSISHGVVTFEYLAKGSKERVQNVLDPVVLDVVRGLQRRKDPSPELLAWKDGSRWRDVRSSDVNDYLRQVVGDGVTAKDFRTWHATVLMAVGLAVSLPAVTSDTARKRAVSRAVTEVSHYLGNTPAVARKSYIDPRVVDLYDDGVTIAPALEELGDEAAFGSPATHGAIEHAVLDLLAEAPDAARRRAHAQRRRRSPASTRGPLVLDPAAIPLAG